MSFEIREAQALNRGDRILHANLGSRVWRVTSAFTSGRNTKLDLIDEQDARNTLSITFQYNERVRVEC